MIQLRRFLVLSCGTCIGGFSIDRTDNIYMIILHQKGSTFQCYETSKDYIQQLCSYAVSKYKPLIMKMIEYRNLYASFTEYNIKPIFYENLIDPDLHKTIILPYVCRYARWEYQHRIHIDSLLNENGDFVVCSIEGAAKLTLFAHGLFAEVILLLPIRTAKTSRIPYAGVPHTYIRQRFLVENTPPFLSYPLSLLLLARKRSQLLEKQINTVNVAFQRSDICDVEDGCIRSKLPVNLEAKEEEEEAFTLTVNTNDLFRICCVPSTPCPASVCSNVVIDWNQDRLFVVNAKSGEVQAILPGNLEVLRFYADDITFFYPRSIQQVPLNFALDMVPTLVDCNTRKCDIQSISRDGRALHNFLVKIRKRHVADPQPSVSGDIVEKKTTPNAVFTAFKDGRVRARFTDDCTILEFDYKSERCMVIDEDGNKQMYALQKVASMKKYATKMIGMLEFRKWAFSTPSERIQLLLKQDALTKHIQGHRLLARKFLRENQERKVIGGVSIEELKERTKCHTESVKAILVKVNKDIGIT